MLLCHGAFGSLHQFKAPTYSDHSTVIEHTSHQEEHGAADGHPLVGPLEPSLREALEFVARRGTLTAPELAGELGLALNTAR